VNKKKKRRDNDNYILNAKNKSKANWRAIHKETGKSSSQKQDIIIVNNSVEVTNPSKVAELLNSYFCEVSKELLEEKGKKTNPGKLSFKNKGKY
jgi:cyanate lyase